VRAFLEYVRDYPAARTSYSREAGIALQKYWGLEEQNRPTGPNLFFHDFVVNAPRKLPLVTLARGS
jgi:hypothetical protein